MVKPYDLIHLSQDSYLKKTDYIPQNFKHIFNSDSLNLQDTGYFGAFYLNEENKEVIIVNSGTNIAEHGLYDTFIDLYNDFKIALSLPPNQFEEGALPFAHKVLEYLGENKYDYKFYFTGHSLGAVLSEITKFELTYKNGLNSEAITFDSPGSRSIIKSMYGNELELKFPLADITSYNGNENIINTVSKPAGSVYHVSMPETQSNIIEEVIKTFPLTGKLIDHGSKTLSYHYLQSLIEYFDPDSGSAVSAIKQENWASKSKWIDILHKDILLYQPVIDGINSFLPESLHVDQDTVNNIMYFVEMLGKIEDKLDLEAH